MPFSLSFYSSFERSLRNLDPNQKEVVQRVLRALYVYYASNGDLFEARKIDSGFFYKQLRRPYDEAGVEGKIRVVIEREKSECYAVLAGNHDQVKRFLAGQ